jgi:eukaryotic-like serine/threonine-protein kinase
VGALLGEGGSARVFAGTDTRLERPVAIKVLRHLGGVDAALIRRFENEGRALAKLSHPNVVAVHDVGCTRDGTLFLVMELATGGTLELELERRELLPAQELVPLLLPVMGALACAHDLGIIHRDLKPGNIALARVGDAVRAKVLDFGIAKSRGVETNSGRAWGTPAYMAPEQARAGEVGPYTDVWAMGITLFHGLSGRLPFDGPVDANLLLQIVSGRAPRLADTCTTIGKQLAIAIDRALEPNPHDRYRDMRELARTSVSATRTGSASSAPTSVTYTHRTAWRRWPRRAPWQ